MAKYTKEQKIMGVTGSIGSGKSEVVKFLSRAFQCECISADEVNRQLLLPDESGWRVIVDTFGKRYLKQDGYLDISRLREDIFGNDSIRLELNSILHPLIREEIGKTINDLEVKNYSGWCFVEIPLLFEVGWDSEFDTILLVYASTDRCVRRVMIRDGISQAEAENVLEKQMAISNKVSLAHHVVDNSGSRTDTYLQLLHLGKLLKWKPVHEVDRT